MHRIRLEQAALEKDLAKGTIDVTLPGRGQEAGSMHPVTRTRLRIERIFRASGISSGDGPEVEDDYQQFRSTEHSAEPPGARDARYVLFSRTAKLLRTHTSPVQIRSMRAQRPPLAVIAPGPRVPDGFGYDAHAHVSSSGRNGGR